MSYTDHSVQRRFKSNTPTDWISHMESQMGQNSPGFHRRVIIKTAFS